jgi:tetratricopeptide (TPR) repeat protein
MSHSDDARIASGWRDDGDELFKNRNFEKAVDCYNKDLELFPRDPDLWNRRGLVLEEQGRYEEAIKSYDRAIEYYLKEAMLWNNKGIALGNMGKHLEAIRCFDTSGWYDLIYEENKNIIIIKPKGDVNEKTNERKDGLNDH